MRLSRMGSNPGWFGSLLALGVVTGCLIPAEARAQCRVVDPPRLFDPPPAVELIPGLQGRQDRIVVGGVPAAKRLLVRYNYGFLLYDLSRPTLPTLLQQKDLRADEKYPVAGDGQTRAGMVSLSADASRALVPWGAADFGTVVLAGPPFSGGGEFAPSGSKTTMTAVARTADRYLAFSSTDSPGIGAQLWVADVTSVWSGVVASQTSQNRIGSWWYAGPSFGGQIGHLKVVEAGTRTYVIAASGTAITVIDVSSPGPAGPGIASGFSHRTYPLSDLGLTGALKSVSAALHPTNGRLYVLAETAYVREGVANSEGVTLSRLSPPESPGGAFGAAEVIGAYRPDATARRAEPGSLLLPFDSNVIAIYFHGASDGSRLDLNVRTSNDFTVNLAAGLSFAAPTQFEGFDGFVTAGGMLNLYLGVMLVGTYSASVGCDLATAPAEATLTVESGPAAGPASPVPNGGTVFIGDELQIRPSVVPSAAIQPITDWRFDYAYHEANPTDAGSVTPFLANPDIPFAPGGPPTRWTLVGPCDPSQEGDQDPATGNGCWASVLASGDVQVPDPAAGTVVPIPLAFEVRNALNESGSSLATHRINWKVPKPRLRCSSILVGESVEDGSEGAPDRQSSAYRWYFASVPEGAAGSEVLTRRADCIGPSCNPGLTRSGSYRYWVSVPYRNGFRTPDCPGLEGDRCSPSTAPVLVVNDALVTPTVSSNSPICEGGTISLATSLVDGATYAWSGPGGFTSTLPNPTLVGAIGAMSGTYSVFVRTNGCAFAAGSTTVIVNSVPATPTASSNSPVMAGQTINLSTPTVPGATYAWVGPDGFTSSLQNPVRLDATPAMAGSYEVTVTTNGCPSSPGETSVVVTPPVTTVTVLRLGAGSGTVYSAPSGIRCGAGCTRSFASGTEVVLTADPSDGSRFVGWAGGGCNGTGACSIRGDGMTLVTATFLPTTSNRFYSITPCRVVDTRTPAGPFGGPALAAAGTRAFALGGACNVPADAAAVSLNVTVADATAPGSLTMYPGTGPAPGTNTISFQPGKNRANNVTMGLIGGTLSVVDYQAAGTVNLIIDVNGYYR